MTVSLHGRIARGKNATLFGADGTPFIDMTSGFGVAAIGYSNSVWVEALAARASTLNHGVSPLPHVFDDEAADAIRVALDRDVYAVLTTGGAEAVEIALKVARLATGRARSLVFSGCYHGQSIGTLGLSSQSSIRDPLIGSFVYADMAPFPNTHQRRLSDDELQDRSSRSLEVVERLLLGADGGCRDIGAVLIEPMQNFSGYRQLPPGFGARLSALCREADVLLISDEVFVGFGRCGAYELSPTVGLEPDIVCFGKAMTGGFPAGACVASPDLLSLLESRSKMHLHSPTFSTSPLTNAAVASAIECLVSMDAPSRSIELGHRIRAGLADLVDECDWLADLRGIGAAQALVIDVRGKDQQTREYVAKLRLMALQEGVLVLDSGAPWGNTIALSPPLVLDEEELETALRGITKSIKAIDLEVRKDC
jgi:4-aminobutyrate aminotransferase-like enzyme